MKTKVLVVLGLIFKKILDGFEIEFLAVNSALNKSELVLLNRHEENAIENIQVHGLQH